ncbi:hypothetical protein Tco_0635565 [Tanacetum coccineum]
MNSLSLVVHSHGSDEGSLKLIELMNFVTKLCERIGVLEDDLKKTKLTYCVAVTKLILKVKKLEFQVKTGKARKRARVVLSKDDEDVADDSSKQGRKLSDAEVQEKANKAKRSTVKRQIDGSKKHEKGRYSRGYLDIVLREEFAEDVESLSTKYPIVDWKTCVLKENFMYSYLLMQNADCMIQRLNREELSSSQEMISKMLKNRDWR